MRMEEAGPAAVSAALLSMSAVTDVVGDRIFNLPYLPERIARPACFHYSEPGGPGYVRTVSSRGKPHELGLRHVVIFTCEGYSSDPVAEAADAVLAAFCGDLPRVGGYRVTAEQLEPWPQILGSGGVLENGKPYREVGDFYQLNIYRIGGN